MIKVVLFDYGRVLFGPWPHPSVRRLAGDLRRHGIKTGILSNTILTVPWLLQIIGGYRGFEPIVLSSKEKVAKPDPKIYQIAIKRSGVNASEILFIVYLAENIRTAEQAGMKVVLAKNSKQIIADVKATMLKENGLEL